MSDFKTLSVRIQHVFKCAGIENIEHLKKYDDKQLLRLRKIGANSLNEIKNFLKKQDNKGWIKIESEEDLPKDLIIDWLDDSLENEGNYINLESYAKGLRHSDLKK